jgi:hypothetical protein
VSGLLAVPPLDNKKVMEKKKEKIIAKSREIKSPAKSS